MRNSIIVDEALPLKTPEDAFEHINRSIPQEELNDWAKRKGYKTFKLIDIKDKLLPYLDNYLGLEQRAYIKHASRHVNHKHRPTKNEISHKHVYVVLKETPRRYEIRDSGIGPNEGQFYNLLGYATSYYAACSDFIQNKINLDTLYKRLSHERSVINSTIAEYREEYWEKHFEDCMTPMGTYECLVDMCTKVLGLIEFIKM